FGRLVCWPDALRDSHGCTEGWASRWPGAASSRCPFCLGNSWPPHPPEGRGCPARSISAGRRTVRSHGGPRGYRPCSRSLAIPPFALHYTNFGGPYLGLSENIFTVPKNIFTFMCTIRPAVSSRDFQ